MATRQQLIELCQRVIAPFIWADKGELYLVDAADDSLSLHLGGTCSGCPGAPMTIRSLIEPTVRALSPTVRLKVTVGARMPAGATKMEKPDADSPISEQPSQRGAELTP